MLLRVETLAPYAVGSDDFVSIRVHADAILFADNQPGGYTPRYIQPCSLYGISMIGPEQSIRAIAAACSMEHDYQRLRLRITGPTAVVEAKWQGPWRCRATVLTRGAMHLVALPEVTIAKLVEGDHQHIIIAEGDNVCEDDLRRAIYERLSLVYSTPLIPLGQPAQCDAEREAAEIWCKAVTNRILQSSDFQRLSVHPDQKDRTWSMAGRLSLGQPILDDLVSKLARAGSLPFPPRSTRLATTPAKDEMSLSA